MSTALALINRIRAKRRDATLSIITDRQGVAYLDFLNSAITTVLEERTWNFQQRGDGNLTTVAKFTFANSYVSSGSAGISIQFTGGLQSTFVGDFQTRAVFTDDAAFGDTNFRVLTLDTTVALSGGTIETTWPGDTNGGSSDGYLFVYEYALPATVRAVTSVRHQESDVSLYFEDAQYTFDRLVPRPHESFSDSPQFVMVGGEILRTAQLSSTGVYGLALRIFPCPESALFFNYSYVYRQQPLTVLTDELVRVPPVLEDLIVELATARVISSLEKDVQQGLPLEARTMKAIDRFHRNHAADYGKSSPLMSLDHVGRASDPSWPPRTVPVLSGS